MGKGDSLSDGVIKKTSAPHLDFFVFGTNSICAFALNLVVFLLVGKTSVLTMNVVGLVKDWLLIAFSWSVIKDTVTPINLFGYFLAFLGVAYYNHAKLQAKEALKAKEAQKKLAQAPRGSISTPSLLYYVGPCCLGFLCLVIKYYVDTPEFLLARLSLGSTGGSSLHHSALLARPLASRPPSTSCLPSGFETAALRRLPLPSTTPSSFELAWPGKVESPEI